MHTFIFQPGEWLGYGKLSFSTSPTVIPFYTKWICSTIENGEILCEQYVEKQGVKDVLFNLFRINDIEEEAFRIELKSEAVGTVFGVGSIHPKTIVWDFAKQTPLEFEGREIYTLQDNGEYVVHAEYKSGDKFCNTIHGRIWMKM